MSEEGHDLFRHRTAELQRRMADAGVDLLLLTDPDSIYYLSGFWGDLGLEFGRPSMLAVARDAEPVLVTASAEGEMAAAMSWSDDIRTYSDGVGGEWRDPLNRLTAAHPGARVAVERLRIPAVVAEHLRSTLDVGELEDGFGLLAEMRMIKSPAELQMIRQAGEVAVAMGEAGKAAIGEGVPEYEVALAVIAGGTRKAAEIIEEEDAASLMSPMIHNLQVLMSGHETSMTHLHPRVRRIRRGEPVYMCFCCVAHFKQLKLGYDREYFVGEVADEHARIYQVAIEAQRVAVAAMSPGVAAQDVHAASVEVYRAAGFGPCYRTGRAIGYSSLEKPELKDGDRTILQPGMVFAVDGGVAVPGEFGARVGDTVIVTEDGTECVTESPRALQLL